MNPIKSTLVLSCVCFLTLSPSQAILASEQTTTLNPVVVSATKYPISSDKIGNIVHVITQEKIESLHITRVEEALNLLPGTTIISSGGISSVRVNGFGSNQTKILLNGIPLKDTLSPQGTPSLDGIDIHNVEQIELIQGGSTVYGSDAMSGLINIITKENTSHLQVYGGDRVIYGSIHSSQSIDNTRIQLGYSRLHDNRFSMVKNTTEKDPYHKDNLTVGISNITGKLQTDVFFNQNIQTKQLDKDNPPTDTTSKSNYTQNLGQIKFGYRTSSKLETTVQYSTSYISYQSFDSNYKREGQTNTLDAYSTYRYHPDWTVVLGANNERDKNMKDESSISRYAYYIQNNYTGDQLSASMGYRRNFYEKNDYADTYNLGLSQQIPEAALLIKTNIGSGFRYPSLSEILFKKSDSLKPEKSQNKSIGVEKTIHDIIFGVTLFENEVENQIIYDDNDTIDWTDDGYRNITKRNSHGSNYSIQFPAFGILDYFNIDYTYLNTKDDGKKAIYTPEKQWRVTTAFTTGKFTTGITYIHKSEVTTNTDRIGAYDVCNIKSSYHFDKQNTIWVGIENVFDQRYYQTLNITQPGRTAIIGFNHEF